MCIPRGGMHPKSHPRSSKCVSFAEGCAPRATQEILSVYPPRRDAPQEPPKELEVCIPRGGMRPKGHPTSSKCVSLAEGCTPRATQGALSVYPSRRGAPQEPPK